LGERGPRSKASGLLVCGNETLSDDELAQNRCSFGDDILAHPLDDAYHSARSAAWDKITVPFLSAANWGGQGLHPRGNFEGFCRAASAHKWLEAHGLEHWTHFYTDYGRDLQMRFFDYFLKGEQNDWERKPRVQLQIRHPDRFEQRAESEWPLARTKWTKLYLDSNLQSLSRETPTGGVPVSFEAMGDGLTFVSAPLERRTEITGPLAAGLRVSSSTADADLFLVFRVLNADLREIVFTGAIDPHTPVAQGWLRASHRKLDESLSKLWRPYHTHDQRQMLTPGEPVDLQVELWPTSIVVPEGCRLALSVRGKDYEWQKTTGARLSNFKNELRGCGPFLHDDPRDRPSKLFAGETTLRLDEGGLNYVLIPIID